MPSLDSTSAASLNPPMNRPGSVARMSASTAEPPSASRGSISFSCETCGSRFRACCSLWMQIEAQPELGHGDGRVERGGNQDLKHRQLS